MKRILGFALGTADPIVKLRRHGSAKLGATRDLVEAPLLIDAIMIMGWAVARLFELPHGVAAVVVVASIVALRWPATGAALAALAFTFPLRPGGLESGAPLLVAAVLGCLLTAARSNDRSDLNPALLFAAALAATTGLALLRVLSGPLHDVATEASLRWAGLVLGLASLPVHLFLVRRGARRAIVVLAGATAAAVGIGCVDGLWPGVLEATPFGSLLSNVPSDRATGSFPSPNRLGTVAAIAAVGTGVLAWERRDGWRLALGLAAAVATITVSASFSRGALLGLFVAANVLIARRSLRLAVVASVLGAVLIFFVTPAFMNVRLGTPAATSGLPAEQAENDAGRIDAWLAGLRMGVAQPITGQGYGAFRPLSVRYGGPANLDTAHNEAIALFAEVGLPGVLSFAGLVASCCWAMRRRTLANDLGLAAVLVFVTASSFNIQSVYPQITTLVWAMVAWGLALGSVAPGAEGAGRVEYDEGNVDEADGRALIPNGR
jgi:O-antigen ligase